MALTASISRPFRQKSFYAGLALSALFFGGAFLWAGLTSDEHLGAVQDSLASQTIPIIRADRADSAHHDASLVPKGDLLEDEKLLEPPPVTEDAIAVKPHAEEPEHESAQSFPIAGLFETTADGSTLPIIRQQDGMSPFRAYSKTDTPIPADRPLIALVINDVGLSPAFAERLHAQLPPEVTFIVNPYVSSLNALEKQWHMDKRELWLKAPFETAGFPEEDPGMRGIMTRVSLSQNMDNFKWTLSRLAAYSGIAAYIDNTYLQARPLLGALAKEGFDRGLGYFELNNSAPPQVKDMAERQKAPYIRNEISLQSPKWNGEIDEAASLLETVAESKGYAIGVLQPYPETIDFLKNWMGTLKAKNFVFVPLSAIYTHKLTQPGNASTPAQASALSDQAAEATKPATETETQTAPPPPTHQETQEHNAHH